MRAFIFVGLILLTLSINATTIHVPSEQPTIQAGIDAAIDGDTVLIADGVYTGEGNYSIVIEKSIVIISANGPVNTIIDSDFLGNCITIYGDQDSLLVIDGITIINGLSHQGAGLCCFGSSPIIKNCVFANNTAFWGGALYFNGNTSKKNSISSPRVQNCTFVNNESLNKGGVSYIQYNNISVSFNNCIFYGNTSFISPCIEYQDFVDTVIVSCSDMYNNIPGDWIGNMSPYGGIENNFSIDPELCAVASGVYAIDISSPCAEEISPCGELVGALNTINCCCLVRGDVAPPTNGYTFVDDLVFLVDYLFKGGSEPNCFEAGDCAIPLDGYILVNDLVYLVDFLFKGGPEPPEC